MFFNLVTLNFERLRREWYGILKSEGFYDIENEEGELKPDLAHRSKARAFRDRPYRVKYFATASEFLHAFEFQTEFDRHVWELFCDGRSLRESSEVLNVSHSTIGLRLKKLKIEFAIYESEIDGSHQDQGY